MKKKIAALICATILTGCGAHQTDARGALSAWGQIRALICGGSEAVETQLEGYLEAAEAKEEAAALAESARTEPAAASGGEEPPPVEP